MKKKLISKYCYTYSGVSLDPVSECVPDQSLSVEEILRRFTQGTLLAADIERSAPYGEDISPDENDDNMDPLYDPEYDLVDAFEDSQQRLFLQDKIRKAKSVQPPHSAGMPTASVGGPAAAERQTSRAADEPEDMSK